MDENALEQTQLLRNIWNEMKTLGSTLGGRIDQTNQRLDQTNQRLDQMRVELKSEIAQTNSRLENVEGSLRDLADQQLILTRVVRNVVDRQDEAIGDLRERVARLESSKIPDDE